MGRSRDCLDSRGRRRSTALGRGVVDVYDRPEKDRRLSQVRVPEAEDLVDYDGALVRSLSSVAEYERRSAAAVSNDLLYFADGVVLLGEPVASRHDISIPLLRASGLLSGM